MTGNTEENYSQERSHLVQAEHKPLPTEIEDETTPHSESCRNENSPCCSSLSSRVHQSESAEDKQSTFCPVRTTGASTDPVRSCRDPEIEDFPGTSDSIRKSPAVLVTETKTPKKLRLSPGIDKSKPRKRKASFAIYVYRVMQQVHPNLGITKKAMNIMDSLVLNMFDRITENAVKLPSYSKARTITSREIETAVKLIMPRELAAHGGADAKKAVSTYLKFQSNK